jgi:hypothetical protein
MLPERASHVTGVFAFQMRNKLTNASIEFLCPYKRVDGVYHFPKSQAEFVENVITASLAGRRRGHEAFRLYPKYLFETRSDFERYYEAIAFVHDNLLMQNGRGLVVME